MKSIAKGNDWGEEDALCFLIVGEISYNTEGKNNFDGEQMEDIFMLSEADLGSFLVINEDNDIYDSDSIGSMPDLQDRAYGDDSSSGNNGDTTEYTTTSFNGDGSSFLWQYQDDLVIGRSSEVYSDHSTAGNSSMPDLLEENSVFGSSCTNSSGTYWSTASPPALISMGTITTATSGALTRVQRKATTVCMSGRALFDRYSSFAT